MRITVKSSEGFHLNLPFPTALALNRFTSGFIVDYMREYGIHVTRKQASAFIRELNRYRRSHPDWILVEVQSSNGDYVKIKL